MQNLADIQATQGLKSSAESLEQTGRLLLGRPISYRRWLVTLLIVLSESLNMGWS